jgi:hypothetical protein
MPDDPKSDYITKTEAATIFRRSERSLSRDITNAIKFQDQGILKNVELHLEDGTRRPGTELTIREIVELRDRGLNPTWLLRTQWLKTLYGRRDQPPPQGAPIEAPNSVTDSVLTPITLPEDLAQRVAVLSARYDALTQTNADLRSQAQRLEKELDRRAEERREENELQKQNNVLMQQVYNLLSKMQETPGEISLLPAPASASRISHTEPTISVEGQVTAQRKGTASAKKSAASKSAGKRSKQLKTAASDAQESSTAVKKYLPTLDRAMRFFSRK